MRLAAIARDRLAYQEYVENRDALDKSIASLYTKLQKKDGPKSHKKKKKPTEVNGATNANGTAVIAPSPAALGLTQNDDYELTVPDQLKHLIQIRRQWVDQVGSIFEAKDQDSPGRIHGLPNSSIFEGIDEQVRQELGRPEPPQHGIQPVVDDARTTNGITNGKGKERAVDVPMELG